MKAKLTLSRTHLLVIGFFLALLLLPIIFVATASATGGSRNRPPANEAEWGAYNGNFTSPGEFNNTTNCVDRGWRAARYGAIWISNRTSTYYDQRINITSSQTSVPVQIRGSVFGCHETGVGFQQEARNVSSASSRLTGLSGNRFSRGDSTGAHNWSRQGSGINATLNVSGLDADYNCDDINISLRRQFWSSDSGGTWGSAGTDVVKVRVCRTAPNWTITPNTTASSTEVSPYNTVTWSHSARNNGPDNTTQSVQLSEREREGASDRLLRTTSRSAGWTAGTNAPTVSSTWTPTQSDVGRVVCRYYTAQPRALNNSSTVSSTERCVEVKVRTTGDFGSWVEYGLLSNGNNDRTSSGYPDYKDGANGERLTFANSPSSINGQFGSLTGTALVNNFPVSQATVTPPNCNNLPVNASGYYNCDNKPVTLSGSTLAAGGPGLIIRTTGKVTISGNISQPNGPYASATGIPQLVIIANQIHISRVVTNVDAWLLTTGSGPGNNEIDTCYDDHGSDRVSTGRCNLQLTVNGPVKTAKLRLFRTFGAEKADPGQAAEVFTLRPDAYLWLYNRLAGSGAKIRTTSVVELPPRY